MAKKRKPRPPRQRSVRPEPGVAPWLAQLRQALFVGDFRERAPHFVASDGTAFHCERALVDDGVRLLFIERWHDPATLERRFHWSIALDAPSFVSVPPELLTRAVETLRASIQALRPAWPVYRVPRRWALPHERLGRRVQGGGR